MRSILMLSAAAAATLAVAPAWAQTHGGTARLDANMVVEASHGVDSSSPPVLGAGLNINTFLGADTFYNNGITGQLTTVANVEGGHIWNGHESIDGKVQNFLNGDLTSNTQTKVDRHATWTGMLIAGEKTQVLPGNFQMGIAPGASLDSGAIATGWNGPAYTNSFSASALDMLYGYQPYMGAVDVVSSSWGYGDPSGTSIFTLLSDALAFGTPNTVMVASAGNAGTANSVGGPGAGYNVITVGATGSANNYDQRASFSSYGPSDFGIFGAGTLVSADRPTVDIVAPGEDLVSAFYGGTTGGNVLGANTVGSDLYSIGIAGTSFSTPIVSGGIALQASNAKVNGLPATALDARVQKAILLNSATKLPGWDNGQTLVSGVIETTQALDWELGAGQMNLDASYTQQTAGATDLLGDLGGTTDHFIGWDFATAPPAIGGSSVVDVVLSESLEEGQTFTVTLSWFRDRQLDGLQLFDNAQSDLDLEVWDATFTTLIARSANFTGTVEHLHFEVPADGEYAIRVRNNGPLFGPNPQDDGDYPIDYGLAWMIVPEPASLSALGLGLLVMVRRR